MNFWAQLFKTNDVVGKCIVKTLIIKYSIYANIFAEENISNLQKLLIFFCKNSCELDTVLTRTVNILTTYELVKLTMF